MSILRLLKIEFSCVCWEPEINLPGITALLPQMCLLLEFSSSSDVFHLLLRCLLAAVLRCHGQMKLPCRPVNLPFGWAPFSLGCAIWCCGCQLARFLKAPTLDQLLHSGYHAAAALLLYRPHGTPSSLNTARAPRRPIPTHSACKELKMSSQPRPTIKSGWVKRCPRRPLFVTNESRHESVKFFVVF